VKPTRKYRNPLPVAVILAALSFLEGSARAEILPGPKLNPAETWVVQQINAGEIADLRAKFPDEKDRTLSGQFLEDLLAGALPGGQAPRHGIRIEGAIVADPVDLTNAQIPWEVWLDDCNFNGSVTMTGASFVSNLSFHATSFAAGVNFANIKVGQGISFTNALFAASANFGAADIAGTFLASEAKFQDPDQSVNFNDLKTGQAAFFQDAVFAGPASFVQAEIGGNLEATGARFQSVQGGATFDGIHVGHLAIFQSAVFAGPADFDGVDIGSNFEASSARFQDKAQGVSFNGAKIEAAALFNGTVFAGPVNFGGAQVGSNFEAAGAKFTDKTDLVALTVQCGGDGYFSAAGFAGPLSFADSSFSTLMVSGTGTAGPPIPSIDLSRASIKQSLSITGIKLNDFVAQSLHVDGPAHFTNLITDHSADLTDSDFVNLDLSKSQWPTDGVGGGKFTFEGMTYQSLRMDADEAKSHDALLHLASQAAYTADIYSGLETYFARQGYRADADRAFIEGQRRERNEHLHGLSYAGSLLLDWLVGYGRHPSQIGIPCAFFVVLGCFLFSPGSMELQDKSDDTRAYNPFWYSLGLFLPFVDLQADKIWKPKREAVFLRNYMRVHILLGWMLIPILVAALTGLIK